MAGLVRPWKVLVAEDEQDLRELVGFALTWGGYRVIGAADGAAAVEKAREELPDLILLDTHMPRMTGYEACQALKRINETRDIPVVFLSTSRGEKEVQQGLETGAIGYILKPFSPRELLAQIAKILRGET